MSIDLKLSEPRRHVSLAHYFPYEGIPHAGGEYVRRHLLMMSSIADCISFVSEDGIPSGVVTPQLGLNVRIVRRPKWGRMTVARILRRAARWWDPTNIGFDVKFAMKRDRGLREAVRMADSVEFQYFEQCPMVRQVSAWNPNARTIAIVHDVVSQRLQRQAAAAGTLVKAIMQIRALAMRVRERRVLQRFDHVTVFSEKDADILRRAGVKTPMSIINVPLVDADALAGMPKAPTPKAPTQTVVFVGAFDRAENVDAAQWLISEIWPRVGRAVDGAMLVIAGANPPASLLDSAALSANVEVTGYVENLADVYRTAAVVAVPVRQGAGVKFKTVTAMIWGIPTVSTSVGAEGIPRVKDFVCIADSATEFAAGVIRCLGGEWDIAASLGRNWALSQYGEEQFRKTLSELLCPR